LATASYVFASVAIAILLILHTIDADGIQVDTTSLGLLVLMLLVPLAPHIRRLAAAGIEAEIAPHDARQLQILAAGLPPPSATATDKPSEAPLIEDLTRRDPPLGLAQLRIQLEREVQRLYALHLPDADLRKVPLGLMVHELRERGVIRAEVAGPLANVTALANRAIHGEYVPADIAYDIAQAGLRVLAALQELS
jgi:hypothetical protein